MNIRNTAKQIFSGIKSGMREFGQCLSAIVNSTLLLLVYIVAVGPTSLIARLVRKRFVEIEVSDDVKSYWSDLNLENKKFDEYYRQF
ncbi:MAG TPA: hypothetical protein VJI75_04195 [Candidatus Nanoarchaeia archaeon]|nr:hypothetical protein [Candidatus Nanoarchaeia archaeon]